VQRPRDGRSCTAARQASTRPDGLRRSTRLAALTTPCSSGPKCMLTEDDAGSIESVSRRWASTTICSAANEFQACAGTDSQASPPSARAPISTRRLGGVDLEVRTGAGTSHTRMLVMVSRRSPARTDCVTSIRKRSPTTRWPRTVCIDRSSRNGQAMAPAAAPLNHCSASHSHHRGSLSRRVSFHRPCTSCADTLQSDKRQWAPSRTGMANRPSGCKRADAIGTQ
jgi:hypothetical protein